MASVITEVPDANNDMASSGHDNSANSEDTGMMEEEAETEKGDSLNNSDKLVISLSEDVQEEQQDSEMNKEVAEDGMVEEEEEMEDVDQLLEQEGSGQEDQRPILHTGPGEQEDEDLLAQDFTEVDVLGTDAAAGQQGRRAGDPEEGVEAVDSVAAEKDIVQSGTVSNKTGHEKQDQTTSADITGSALGKSASFSTTTSRPSVVKSSPVPVKKSPTSKNINSASKASPSSAKPVRSSKTQVSPKPTKVVSPKTAIKPVSATKPGGVQKVGLTPPNSAPVSKQATNKVSVAQTLSSNPKPPSRSPTANGPEVADASADKQTAGTGDSGDNAAATIKAAEDYIDVQVNNTMLSDIDADLDGEQTSHNSLAETAEDSTADEDASDPKPDAASVSEADTSVAEQPSASSAEQQPPDAAMDQDLAQEDKPEEKKDEKDSKSIKSATATKPVKSKDDKANSRNLWVSGLSSSTRATDLKNLFGKYGKVVGAKVVTNARSPGWRCYGFVTMALADETTKCIQHLHRTELHGKMISVERFSSFKAKTGGPAKTSPASKNTITARSITGKPTAVTITTTKTTPSKKEDKKAPGTPKEGDKKPVKKEGQDGRKDTSKEKPDEKKTYRKDDKDQRKLHQGSLERNRHRESEKTKEQRERDMLSFEKIRAERERERLRQKELQLRCEERYRLAELDRERQRQKMISRKQRDEALQLEREKERIRMEKEQLEYERQEAERMRRETARLKRIAEEKLRREQERLEGERRAIKRPIAPPKAAQGNYWGEAAKHTRKELAFKSLHDREYRREERREDRGSHHEVRDHYSGRDSRGVGSTASMSRTPQASRDTRKVSGSHHSWSTSGSHSKVDCGWSQGQQGGGSTSDRWMNSAGGSAGYSSAYGSRGVTSSSRGNMYLSHSANNNMSDRGMSRQQNTGFNIAALTTRRF